LKRGIVNAGSKESPLQVHHKISPFINGEINWELAYDDSNLETICGECHGRLHAGVEKSPEEIIAELDNLLK
jgi:hypothetical protein